MVGGHGSRCAFIALAIAVGIALTGCFRSSDDEVLELPRWQLFVGQDARGDLSVPQHFADRLPASPTTFRLTTRAELPPSMRDKELTLAIARYSALASLRIDGRAMAPLDTEDSARHRMRGPLRWRIPKELTARDALELELVVTHTWTQSAWLDTMPRLSATPRGDARFLFVRTFNEATGAAALAMLLMAASVYGIVYLLDRRRVAYGFFALEATGAIYPAFELGVLQPFVGTYELPLMTFLVAVGNAAAVHFTHAQFGERAPHRAWWLPAIIAVAALPFARGPFDATRFYGALAMFVTIANVLYQLFFFGSRIARQRTVPMASLAILVSWTLLGIGAIPDFMGWLGLGEPWGGLRGASLGIAGIAVLQSAALAREHSASMRQGDALNAELAQRVRLLEESNVEVQHLNEELRRQIAARSQQLSDVLVRSASPPSAPALPGSGDVIHGRYRIIAPIGAGGMGAVFEARRLKDDRRVAIKLLHGHATNEASARFAREAQLAAQLAHPNIVNVLDVDVTEGGRVFLVMEFIDGASLDKLQAQFGDVTRALSILKQIAAGLAAMHAKGIIHRDLKPANVLIASSSGAVVAKLADFGISTLATEASPMAATLAADGSSAGDSGGSLTRTGHVLGTPLYMAPEAFRGAKFANQASDVFSFGVIAGELLCGHYPFAESSVLARMMGRSHPAPPSFAVLCPALDAALADVFDRCVSQHAGARPTADELARALA